MSLTFLSTKLTFLSSFSEADGDTPRISYSLVSATFAMMLVGYTQRPSAEVQPIGWAERSRRKDAPGVTPRSARLSRRARNFAETRRAVASWRRRIPETSFVFFVRYQAFNRSLIFSFQCFIQLRRTLTHCSARTESQFVKNTRTHCCCFCDTLHQKSVSGWFFMRLWLG